LHVMKVHEASAYMDWTNIGMVYRALTDIF
jgi:hypothetical protein